MSEEREGERERRWASAQRSYGYPSRHDLSDAKTREMLQEKLAELASADKQVGRRERVPSGSLAHWLLFGVCNGVQCQ